MQGVMGRVPAWAREDVRSWMESARERELWTRWIYLYNFFVEAGLPEVRKRLFCLRGLELPEELAQVVREAYAGEWGPYEDAPGPVIPPGTKERDRKAIEARWCLEMAKRMWEERDKDKEVLDVARGVVMGEAYDLEGEMQKLEAWMKAKRVL